MDADEARDVFLLLWDKADAEYPRKISRDWLRGRFAPDRYGIRTYSVLPLRQWQREARSSVISSGFPKDVKDQLLAELALLTR